MVKTVIIEDEVGAQNHLKKLLTKFDAFHIEACLGTVSESIKWLNENIRPDLIFMDIQLSDGVSFEILEEVELECPIIYTTAYDQYAIRAFKTTGIDYLLKPITEEDLKQAINKFYKLKGANVQELQRKYIELVDAIKMEREVEYKQRFLLKTGNQLTPVHSLDIAYFFIKNEVVFAKLFNGQSYIIDDSLNRLEELIDPRTFFRVSRQVLTNLDAIKKLTTYKPGHLEIKLSPPFDERLQLSQERSSTLKRVLSTN